MTEVRVATFSPNLARLGARSRVADAVLLVTPLVVGGVLGGLLTADAIPTWYAALAKPAWNPPTWLFAPVWSALYLLMGWAWLAARRSTRNGPALLDSIFAVQLGLNLLWTVVFFGLRDVGGGLAVIVLMWVAIALCVVVFAAERRAAGFALLPYLAWVSFATLLNHEIWRLNPS